MAFGAAGELFASSPSVTIPSGSTGDGWVYRLADGDRDGVAEVQPYLQATDVHGLTLSATHLYFTRTKRVLSTTYSPMLNRADPASVEMVAQIPGDFDGRWTHAVVLRADGRLFVTQGRFVVGSEGMVPEIYEVQREGVVPVVVGLENPLWIRCHPTTPFCWAAARLHSKLTTPLHAS